MGALLKMDGRLKIRRHRTSADPDAPPPPPPEISQAKRHLTPFKWRFAGGPAMARL